jgi:predicted esterase
MKLHGTEDTMRFGAPLGKATAALILIHGRGSSPDAIAGLADHLPGKGIAFLAPAATGGTWYPQRFLMPLEANEPWLSSALDVIGKLAAEAQGAGVDPASLGLIGFSQGACLALEFAARNPRRYRLVAGLSGALIGPPDTPRAAADLRRTPVLLACAERDPHIPVDYVERSALDLVQMGADLTKLIFPGGAHTVFPEELTWLGRQLSADSAHRG